MAVSIAQYVDLLFKKLQGVAKTANSTVKGASNESIASPAFLRGDVVWMQSDQIPATAQTVGNITLALTGVNSIQCAADTTVPPIGGIRPTWLSNTVYWISQEFGSTWLPKVYVGPPLAANIEATGTQIFSAGIGGLGEYYFDTQAGVLNFIGETIPSVLTSGNVIYISGYQYVGDLGVTNIPSGANIGNLQISNTTITTTLANGNITLNSTGSGLVTIGGTSGVVIPSGNSSQRPDPATYSTLRLNTDITELEYYDGAAWLPVSAGGGSPGAISNQQINPDGINATYTLNQSATNDGVIVSINGVIQIPGYSYNVSGTNITFTEIPLTADIIDIRFISYTSTVSALVNSSGNTSVGIQSNGNIVFTTSSTVAATINPAGVFIIRGQSLQLPSYTVAQASNIAAPSTGQVIYVTNGNAGLPSLAVYDGSSWKRIALGTTISAT